MEKLNIQIVFLVVVSSVIILSLLFASLVCWPKYLNLADLQNSVKAKEQEISWQKEYFLNLDRIKNELKNYEQELLSVESALPRDSSVPALLNFLQIAASQSGLILKEISPFTVASSEDIANVKEIQMSFVFEGLYSSFKNLVLGLENSARFIDVENISFASPKEKSPFTFNIRVKVYSY